MRKIKELQAYMARLEDYNEPFDQLFSDGVDLLDIADRAITARFGVSRPTIQRWKNGLNAPAPAFQHCVYDWLIDVTRRALDMSKPVSDDLIIKDRRA